MSKKREDHTLSDLLQLKMTWFYDKNDGRQDQIAYIKQMISINAFNQNVVLSKIFPDDYKIPESTADINKLYFTAYEATEKFDPIPQPDEVLRELCLKDKSSYESRIRTLTTSRDNTNREVERFTTHIRDYIRKIADANTKIIEQAEEIRSLEAKIAEPDAYDEDKFAELTGLKANGSPFLVYLVRDNQVTFVSREQITCKYSNNDTYLHHNFGHAFVVLNMHRGDWSFDSVFFEYHYDSLARHPHISSSGSICAGNVSHIIPDPSLPLIKRFNALYSLLITYNAENPYTQLEEYADHKHVLNPKLPTKWFTDKGISLNDLRKEQMHELLYSFSKGRRSTTLRADELWEHLDDVFRVMDIRSSGWYNRSLCAYDRGVTRQMYRSIIDEDIDVFRYTIDAMSMVNIGSGCYIHSYLHSYQQDGTETLEEHIVLKTIKFIREKTSNVFYHYTSLGRRQSKDDVFMNVLDSELNQISAIGSSVFCAPLCYSVSEEEYESITQELFDKFVAEYNMELEQAKAETIPEEVPF